MGAHGWIRPPGPDHEDQMREMLAVLAAPGPLGAEPGTFYIDPERAEECIRKMRDIATDLTKTRHLLDLAYFPPPGQDQVSLHISRQASVMNDRAVAYIDSWRTQLLDTATALEQQLAAYRAGEDAIRESFT